HSRSPSTKDAGSGRRPHPRMAAEAARLASGRENLGQLLRRDDLQLQKGAVERLLVGAPSSKLRRVPEATALHVVVGYLDHQLRAQRLPREVLALAPAARRAGHAPFPALPVTRPLLPGVRSEGIFAIRRQERDQLS